LNILNAITWTAEAWNNVTDDIIYRSWQRTGILPEEYSYESEEEIDVNNIINENIETSLQLLINKIGESDNNNIIAAEDYINIDSSLETTGIPNDDEIISNVIEVPEVEEENNSNVLPVSNKMALESIENIHNYLQQQQNLNVKHSFLVDLKDLQHQICLNQLSLSKQSSLNEFF
jgi:hypothetical protein